MPRIEFVSRPNAQRILGKSDEYLRKMARLGLLTEYRTAERGRGVRVSYDAAELELLGEGRLDELREKVAAKKLEVARRRSKRKPCESSSGRGK